MERFKVAVEKVDRIKMRPTKSTIESKLKTYALFKQATKGDAPDVQPTSSSYNPLKILEAKQKHKAWRSFKGVSKERAMEEYCRHVDFMEAKYRPK